MVRASLKNPYAVVAISLIVMLLGLVPYKKMVVALNGMRTPAHVDDSMTILGWEPLPNVPRMRIYEAVRQG